MILVTGATGHIGQELVPQLLELGQSVRVFTRDARKIAHFGDRVECAQGDFDQPESLIAAMQNVDRMFLVTFETRQDIHALAAAKQMGVRQVVKLSTLEAEMPGLPIGVWHLERENLIRASGLDWTFLRPGMFMSNAADWWADSIKKQGAVYFPGGDGQVAPIDPRDIAAVAAVALTQPGHAGQIHELTGPELLTIGEQAQIISRVIGKRVRYTNIPIFVARLFMKRNGMNPVLVDALMKLAKNLRDGKAAQLTQTVPRITGRSACTFEKWCRDHAAVFQA